MDDPITAAVKQAAREAVAREMAEGDRVDANTIAMIRAGHFDNHVRVESAIMGALAAVPVVREMVRADVLRDVALRLPQEIAELPDRTSPEQWPEAMLVTADEIETIILALAEKEDTGR